MKKRGSQPIREKQCTRLEGELFLPQIKVRRNVNTIELTGLSYFHNTHPWLVTDNDEVLGPTAVVTRVVWDDPTNVLVATLCPYPQVNSCPLESWRCILSRPLVVGGYRTMVCLLRRRRYWFLHRNQASFFTCFVQHTTDPLFDSAFFRVTVTSAAVCVAHRWTQLKRRY